jgi:hypothetical protein
MYRAGDAKITLSGDRLCTIADEEDPNQLRGLPADAVFADEDGCNGGEWFMPIVKVVTSSVRRALDS